MNEQVISLTRSCQNHRSKPNIPRKLERLKPLSVAKRKSYCGGSFLAFGRTAQIMIHCACSYVSKRFKRAIKFLRSCRKLYDENHALKTLFFFFFTSLPITATPQQPSSLISDDPAGMLQPTSTLLAYGCSVTGLPNIGVCDGA